MQLPLCTTHSASSAPFSKAEKFRFYNPQHSHVILSSFITCHVWAFELNPTLELYGNTLKLFVFLNFSNIAAVVHRLPLFPLNSEQLLQLHTWRIKWYRLFLCSLFWKVCYVSGWCSGKAHTLRISSSLCWGVQFPLPLWCCLKCNYIFCLRMSLWISFLSGDVPSRSAPTTVSGLS